MVNLTTQFKRKYSYDKNFFAEPNDINSYWAGFLAADGCINVNNYGRRLEFFLKDKDVKSVEDFKKSILHDGPILDRVARHIFCSKGVAISLYKETMLDLANKWNIVPQKSLVLIPPTLSDQYINHFIRGYMDGDGSIFILTSSLGYKSLGVCFDGTYDMLYWIKNHIKSNVNVAGSPSILKHDNIFKLTFGGTKQTIPILDWIYYNSTPNTRLSRKYDKYMEHK